MRFNGFKCREITSKEIHDILIFQFVNKPSSKLYFEELFTIHNLNCEQKLRTTTFNFIQYILHSFQCKILNNVNLLAKKITRLQNHTCIQHSVYRSPDDMPLHLFYEYNSIKSSWNQLWKFYLGRFNSTLFNTIDCHNQIINEFY